MRNRNWFVAGILLTAPALWAQGASSLLDQPAAAPVLTYAGGMLTIQAANSSLRAILDAMRDRTGVTVQGLAKDERIFGVYGPGNPQEVLSALLDDSGYNVLISGRKPDGSPREIVLSTRSASAPSAQTAANTQSAQEDDDSEAGEQAPPPPQQGFFGMAQGQVGPGAPVQPSNGQPNTPQNGQPQPVRTPQQMLEELQRMRQTQQPQQPQQQ